MRSGRRVPACNLLYCVGGVESPWGIHATHIRAIRVHSVDRAVAEAFRPDAEHHDLAILADRWVVRSRLLKVRRGGLTVAIGMRYVNLPFLGIRHERTIAGKGRRINIDVSCNRGPEADIVTT